MKYLTISLIVFTFLLNTNLYSQETKILNEGTIENQLDFVINKSGKFKEYKVVKKTWIYTLKAHVLDSLQKEKYTIIEANKLISKKQKDFSLLQEELIKINKQLDSVTNSKNTIKLFGIEFEKDLFKMLIGILVALLVLSLSYTIYVFKNSNKITKKTLLEYTELESEYNSSRTRALEREQSLNRKLQDEINKQNKK